MKKLPKLPYGQGSFSYHNDLIAYRKRIKKDDGTYVTKTVYAKTPQECMDKMRQEEVSIQKEIKNNKNILLVDAMNTWLDTYKKNELKPQSYMRIYSVINHNIKNSDIGHYNYNSIKPEEIQLLLKEYNDNNYAHSTIKKIYDALNAFYRFVCIRDKIDNPMMLVNMPTVSNVKRESKTIEFFEQDDIDKFIEEAHATWKTGRPRYQGGLLFAANIYLGLRIGELLALQWKDIDFNKNTIYVCKTLIEESNPDYDENIENSRKVRFVVQQSNKTSKNRYVPINSKAMELLKEHKARCIFTEEDDFVLSTRNRKTTTIKNATTTIQAIENNAETSVVGSGTHILRHTCASLYFRKGVPIETICKILGNTREVCEKTYIHFIEEQLKDAASKIDIIEI